MPRWVMGGCPRCQGSVSSGIDIDQDGKTFGIYLNCINCGWDKLVELSFRPGNNVELLALVREELQAEHERRTLATRGA